MVHLLVLTEVTDGQSGLLIVVVDCFELHLS